jgi:hypothetical protein
LLVALQMLALTLAGLLMPFAGGPKHPAKAPAGSQMSAAQTQTQTVQAPTATVKADRRASAVFATKLYEPRATEVFNLATSRAESAQQSLQESESPNARAFRDDCHRTE